MRYLLVLLLLLSCAPKYKMEPKVPVDSMVIDTFTVGSCVITTFEHNGCLWIQDWSGSGDVDLEHHPKCTNHSTTFR